MSIHTPEVFDDGLVETRVGPFLRALTAAVLAVTSISGQTGCAALNAARVKVVGSDFDKKLLDLDEQANEVKNADIPNSKKAELLEGVELNKKILKAYIAYKKREQEIAKMEEDAKTSKNVHSIGNVKSEIIEEYRLALRDPSKAPLKDMLAAGETALVENLNKEIEKANATLKDEGLKKVSKFEWPEMKFGGRAKEDDVRRWVEDFTRKIADCESSLKKLNVELARLVAQKAAPADIDYQKEAIDVVSKDRTKATNDLASLYGVIKGIEANAQLKKAFDTVEANPVKIHEVGWNALRRAERRCDASDGQ